VGEEVKKILFRAVAGYLGLASFFSAHLLAQQLATLKVTVADPSGRVISQARVAVRNVDTGAKRTDLSSAAGIAVIPGLSAGSYQLTVESDQFSPNVNGIDTVYGAPDFLGPIPRQYRDGASSPANPTFGTPNFVAPARQIQLSVRLTF
jgi:hypothetical protein